MSLAATVAEKANLIWAIADKLTGVFKPHQYGEVILPLTVIRRFDSVLEPTKEMVLQAAQLFAGALGKSRGGHFRSKQLYNLSFKGYNSRFAGEGEFAWLSRDAAAGKRFENDPQRNFIFTANGYYALFSVLAAVSKPAWAEHYPKDMPTLFLAGDMDPVGNYGKGPTEIYNRLVAAGVKNVSIKLYPGARHELHNETNKEEFFTDVLEWIKKNGLMK